MTADYESLERVRTHMRLSWYRCPIEPARLKELTRRSDLRGALQTAGHVLLIAATGVAAYFFFNRRVWVGFILSLFAHGTVYSFIGGLATHELSHGTVFKTKWLNGVFLRILSLVSWFNFHNYKMSHTYHHLYTLHPHGDREVVLPIRPLLHPLLMLQLFTLNVVGGGEPWSHPVVPVIGGTVRLAFSGKFDKEWLEAVFADQEAERKKAVNWARMVLLFNAVVVALSIVFKLWLLPILVTFAPFIANWLRYFIGAPMHTGLRDNVADFRLCVRTITLDPFSRFVYWRMNWHTEHNMFAAVPCYNLRKLHGRVASDIPKPQTLAGAWHEMRQTWKKQQEDPGYQYDTPLPGGKGKETKKQDPLGASLGDLAPTTLDQDAERRKS